MASMVVVGGTGPRNPVVSMAVDGGRGVGPKDPMALKGVGPKDPKVVKVMEVLKALKVASVRRLGLRVCRIGRYLVDGRGDTQVAVKVLMVVQYMMVI